MTLVHKRLTEGGEGSNLHHVIYEWLLTTFDNLSMYRNHILDNLRKLLTSFLELVLNQSCLFLERVFYVFYVCYTKKILHMNLGFSFSNACTITNSQIVSAVVYFDQHLGAPHSKRWSKWPFSAFLLVFSWKKQEICSKF